MTTSDFYGIQRAGRQLSYRSPRGDDVVEFECELRQAVEAGRLNQMVSCDEYWSGVEAWSDPIAPWRGLK